VTKEPPQQRGLALLADYILIETGDPYQRVLVLPRGIGRQRKSLELLIEEGLFDQVWDGAYYHQ